MKRQPALKRIIKEYEAATHKFGPFVSAHEGYAVILEELDELWDCIKHDKAKTSEEAENNLSSLTKEATQVAATALRFLVDCC